MNKIINFPSTVIMQERLRINRIQAAKKQKECRHKHLAETTNYGNFICVDCKKQFERDDISIEQAWMISFGVGE